MPATKSGKKSTGHESPEKSASAIVPWMIAGFLFVAIGGTYAYSTRLRAPTDDVSLCLLDRPPPSLSIVLIDVTETLSLGEQSQILNEIQRIRDAIPRFGKFEVYALGRSVADVSVPKISVCNPGRGDEVNGLYANPALVESQWQNSFGEPLDEALGAIVSSSAGDQSLLMEGIRTVAHGNFGRADYDQVPKHLLIFSDFLQNADGYSQYTQSDITYQEFKSLPYAASIETNLQSVEVSAYYISRPRSDALQDNAHVEFWLEYFEAAGASVNRVKRILGD